VAEGQDAIYEYQCTECGASHEALQKLSDAPLVDCPACAQPGLKKRISAAGFRLTGSGWYETDFKTGDKKKNLGSADSTEKSAKKEAAKETTSDQSGGKKDTSVKKTEAAARPE
jgi:putative regulatory protein, FmdB family